jgi:hypothetical protein
MKNLYGCLIAFLVLIAASNAPAVVINEIRIDHTGTDTDEYFELKGTPNESLAGYTYIVIGDDGTGSGIIESVASLGALTIQADGYLAVHKATTTGACTGYDMDLTLNSENSDNVTHMLVTGFTGALNQDIDTNNDGVLDSTPWTTIEDCVAMVTATGPPGGDYVYCATTAGPDGSFVPGHILRCPDGTGNWAIGSFSNLCTFDTPGAANNCSNLPPTIFNVHHLPCAPTAAQTVDVLADVVDPNANVTSVRVYYKLEAAVSFDSVTASLSSGDTYEATLPAQIDQSRVVYYIGARDATGNFVKSPSTAPTATRDYRVGLQTIASIQSSTTADSCLSSTLFGKAVNVVGVVTHAPYEYSDDFFYIQSGIGPNSGIKVFAPDSSFVPNMGDSVRVSGYIDEFRCQTEVVVFTDCGTVLGTNRRVRARQLANLSDVNNEINESMLVTIAGPMTVATGFDTTNIGSEFKVGTGSNITYVGDDTFFPDLVGYTVVPTPGMVLDALTGIVATRRPNSTPARPDPTIILHLDPRRDNDVDRDYTDVGDDDLAVVRAFHLRQNAPNPFNPLTKIEFDIPAAGRARLEIYDAAGRVVRVLVDRDYAGPRRDSVVWDGRDDAGQVVSSGVYFYKLVAGDYAATRKMLLLK